jgi:hypothetical protein
MGRAGERAAGKATVNVVVSHVPHEFQLIFRSRPFKTLDGLVEDVRKEVEKIGTDLAAAASESLL